MGRTSFYLGGWRRLDGTKGGPCRMPAHHLVTHGVITGMTGSGKTGLVMVLVEEALRSKVPVLVVDVKGDLPNLLLAFPTFAPAELLPAGFADLLELARRRNARHCGVDGAGLRSNARRHRQRRASGRRRARPRTRRPARRSTLVGAIAARFAGLRALLVFDEVYGFLPPHPANPPTKRPLVALMKQARAFGVGVVVATQNPMDLDYRALSNAGLWCLGRLQTDADRARDLDGLGATGHDGDRAAEDLGETLRRLSPRYFVMRDAHANRGAVLLQPRWTMSFMRGPMTRGEIRAALEHRGAKGKEMTNGQSTKKDKGGLDAASQLRDPEP